MFNHRQLCKMTENYEKTIDWMFKNNFIPSEMYCSECNNKKMKLENIRNKKRWRCTKCNKTFSLFKNTILENCKKDISEILDIIYFWSLDLTQNKAMIEGNSNSIDTIFNWYKKLRIQTYYIMINTRASKIGGIGHVVEVDEAKFSKRKYEIGRIVRSAWVVGGVDLTTGETFFVEVFYRNEDTLSQVLLDNIEEGTIVVTDCWAGYVNLDSLGFIHYTVNHSLNFVDPITGANTQAIENRWSVLKRKLRARFVTSRSDLCFYFAEFIFKSKFKKLSFIKIMENLTSFD